MTKKALIILFMSIGGALVVAGSTTAIVINNSTKYVDDPTADATSFVYNGSEQTYTLKESELYTITGNKKTDAGEYSVVVSLNNKDKYAWKSTKKNDDLIFNFTIDKKGVLEPSSDTSLFEYTGNEITYTVTSEDSSFYTVTNNKATNAGTYNATISLNDTKNYKWKNSNKSGDLSLPFTISQKDVSSLITIDDIEDIEYTGEHINPNVTLKTAIPEYEIAYGENINVGKGTVTITAKGNFKGSKTFEFNIIKKKISIPTPTTTEYTYTGSEIIHNIPESEYYDISNNKATNAGNYSATLSLKDKANTAWSDGTNDDKELNFKINPITILESNVQNINNEIYTGLEIAPEVNIAINNYTLIKDTDYELTYSNNINAGIASVTIIGKGNYTGTVIKTFNISKKTPTVTAPTPVSNLRQTGADYELVTAGSTSDGTMQYALALDGTYRATIPTGNNAGEYKVYYKVVGDENIEDVAPQYITVTIAKPYAEYTAPVANNLTYDGIEQPLVTAGTTSHGTIEYSLDGENYSESIPNGTNASEYTVYFRIVPDDDHDSPETAPLIVTIAQRPITITLTSQNASWTGNEPVVDQALYTTGDDQLVTGDSLGITIIKADGTDVGEYDLTATITNTNYNPTFVNSKYTITAVDSTSTTAPAAKNLVYNGSAQTLITAGVAVGGTYMYKLGDGQFSESLPQATDANTYTITYYIKGDNNHNDSDEGTFDVTINKAAASFTAPTAKDLTYTGSAQALINAATTSDGTPLYSSTENGEYLESIPTGTDASEYVVWYYIAGDTNHNDSDKASINVTISKKEIVLTALSPVDYNATAQTPAVTSEYELTDNTFTKTEAGTYNVELKLTDTANTKWAGLDTTTTTVPWTINKININQISVTGIENKTHNGNPVEFTTTIKLGEIVLDNNDFTLAYRDSNNQNLDTAPSATGTYKAIITGKNFNGELSITFKILKAITSTMVQPIALENRTYTGSAITPIVLIDGSSELEEGVDYTITYDNNINAGDASYTVTGIGNYSGTINSSFTIEKAPINIEVNPLAVSNLVDDGSEKELITAGTINPSNIGHFEYKLGEHGDWGTNIPKASQAGTYTVYWKVIGDSNHKDDNGDSIEVIIADPSAKSITSEMVSLSATSFTYNGQAQTPTVTVIDGDDTLVENTHYTLSITGNQKDANEYTITITGKGNYNNSSTTKTYTIAQRPITITLTSQNASWTGNEPVVDQALYTTGDDQLVTGDSLGITIIKADGTDVGEYDLTATITNTNYNPTFVNSKYTITAVDSTSTTAPAAKNLVYNGSAQTLITAGVAVGGTYMYKLGDGQFSESLPQATDANTYTITYYIKGDNNHNDSDEGTFDVTINKAAASFTAPTAKDLTYTGSAQALINAATTSDGTPLYSSTENGEYLESIPTGTDAGEYEVWYYIDGNGNHDDSAKSRLDVTIKKAQVAKPTATTTSYTYTGTAITHNLTASDYYTITDNTGINVGNYTAKVNLNDSNNYCWKETSYTSTSIDELEFVFEITPKALTDNMVTLSDNSFEYNGINQKPTVTVTDSPYLVSTDYELTNDGGIHVGAYDVTVVAQGNYTGTITKQFNITQREVTIKLNNQSSPYKTNGAYIVNQTLDQGAFTVTSGSIITNDDLNIVITKAAGTNVGNYALTATYNNNDYNVTFVNGTYSIVSQSINIADATIKLNNILITDPTDSTTITYTYNGSVQKPNISIISNTQDVDNYELILDTDYTISISGNQTNASTYTITITAKGNYFVGSTTRMYTITKKVLSNYDLTLETVTYNGTEQAPTTFTLIDSDINTNVTNQFYITSTKQINAGTSDDYKITIAPKPESQSSYVSSTINTTYTIEPRNINSCTFTGVYDVPFTTNVATNGYFPEPTITYNTFDLVKNTDYTLSYGANNFEGTGTVTITGQGNFTSTKTIGFSIHKNDVTYTFDPNGGSLNDSTEAQNVKFTYPYNTLLPTPTKEHYDFAGWKTSTYPYKTFNVNATLDQLVGYTTFNAQWTLHNYIITYKNIDDENAYNNPKTRTIDDSAFTLIRPDDDSFLGWYSDESLETEITTIPAPLGNDMTIYAKWNNEKYTIIYHTNGGNNIEDGEYYQTTSTFSLPIPTRDDYEFEGWYENSSLTGTKVTHITQGSTGNKEFWANWTPTTYYITYKLNDGELDPSNSNPTNYTVATPTFVLNNPTKGGNIFVGWFDDSIGGNKITQIAEGSHGNLTLYARYTPIPTTFVIEITHDLSGSTTDQAGTITGENLGTKSVGNSITKTFTVNDTYTFLGWYNGDTLESSNPELTVTLTENTTTYTAKVARYKLVLNKNDGGLINPPESLYLRAGEQKTLTATTDLGGYVFCGWFRGAETTPVTTEKTLNITMGNEDVAYRAKWSHVTLTILNSDESSNNSVTSMLGKDYVVDGTIDLTASPASDYAFQGWYSGDNKLSGDLTYTYTFKNENETLYAKFVKNLITVNQGLLDTDLTGGDEPFFIMSTGGNYGTYGTNNIMDEDEKVTYTATNRSDLMFAGWYEVGETGLVVGDPSSTQTTYSLISSSRDTSIKLAPGTIKTIYPIFISKLGANAQPSTLLPTTSGSNFSGDPLVITPQSSDAYEFTKYTIDGVDVAANDPRLSIVDGKTVLTYTEDLNATLASASNYRNRVQIIAVYTRTSALVQAGKLDNSTFVETSTVGSVTKNGDVYTATPATGYEFVKWQWQKADGSTNRADLTDERVSGNILTLGSEDYEDYFAIFAPLTNIQYTVNYYLQNTDNDNYTLDHSTTLNNGTTDKDLTVTPDSITGATLKTTDLTKTIAGDGSTEFDLYFDRKIITVNYQYNNGTSTALTPVSVRYGSLPKENTVTGWTKTVAGWYTDCDFTNEFIGKITYDKIPEGKTLALYAKWQGDIVLTDTNVIEEYSAKPAYVAVMISDNIVDNAITNDQDIVIPSYYNGYPVTIVDVNNLIVNYNVNNSIVYKIYSKVTMPETINYVLYGKYNTTDVTWIVLDTEDGYKLLSKSLLGSACKGDDASIASAISSIDIKYNNNPITYSLMSENLVTTYSNTIFKNENTVSNGWWLIDIPSTNKRRYVKTNGSIGDAGTSGLITNSYYIRPYIEL